MELHEEARSIELNRTPTREALWQKRLEREEVLDRQHRRSEALRRHGGRRLELGDVVTAVLRATGIFERGRRNALRPVLRRVDMRFPELPHEFDGFTLMQMSDFHFDKRPGYVETVAELVESLEVDVCALTGDYNYYDRGPSDRAVAGMAALLPSIRARHGVYAILGNHDHSGLVEPYEAMGIRWLINANVEIARGEASLYLAGIDDNHGYRSHSVPLALEGAPEDGFKVLLAHSPAIVREAAREKVQLCLCGHTHAGQVRLPWVGAVFLNAPNAPRRVCAGAWRYGTMRGYTSAGLGATASPVRFNCPPEVTVIRLLREA
jgi:predicted MPP superfamily phosphohydrolase